MFNKIHDTLVRALKPILRYPADALVVSSKALPRRIIGNAIQHLGMRIFLFDAIPYIGKIDFSYHLTRGRINF